MNSSLLKRHRVFILPRKCLFFFSALSILCFVIVIHNYMFADPYLQAREQTSTLGQAKMAPVSDRAFRKLETKSIPDSQEFTFCGKSTGPCVFDLGFNIGRDTAYYLSQNHSRVVAVEANPTLAEKASKEEPFKSAIAEGRLKLLSVGISASRDEGSLTFWIHKLPEYSSFMKEVGCRKLENGRPVYDAEKYHVIDESSCRPIKVPTLTCAELVERFGSPDYMKIDLEGIQTVCVDGLHQVKHRIRPKYVSIEGCAESSVVLLQRLGYTQFKVVDQYETARNPNTGSSGPWGSEALDFTTGERWRSGNNVMKDIPLPRQRLTNGKMRSASYDLHGRMADI